MFKGISVPLEFSVVPRFGKSLTDPQTREVGFQARACACRGRWLVYLSVRGVSFSSFGGSNARSARNCFPTVRFVTESDGRRFFSFHPTWCPVTNTRHRVSCVAVRERNPILLKRLDARSGSLGHYLAFATQPGQGCSAAVSAYFSWILLFGFFACFGLSSECCLGQKTSSLDLRRADCLFARSLGKCNEIFAFKNSILSPFLWICVARGLSLHP